MSRKFLKETIPVIEFVRYPKGSVMYYEILGKNHNAAADSIRKASYKAKLKVGLVSGFDSSRKPIYLARVEILSSSTAKRQKKIKRR